MNSGSPSLHGFCLMGARFLTAEGSLTPQKTRGFPMTELETSRGLSPHTVVGTAGDSPAAPKPGWDVPKQDLESGHRNERSQLPRSQTTRLNCSHQAFTIHESEGAQAGRVRDCRGG